MKPVNHQFTVEHIGTVTLADDVYVAIQALKESDENLPATTSMIFDQLLRSGIAALAADPEREAGTIAELREQVEHLVKIANGRGEKMILLTNALEPFTHDDLSRVPGHIRPEATIYQRGDAALTLADFQRARKAYEASK